MPKAKVTEIKKREKLPQLFYKVDENHNAYYYIHGIEFFQSDNLTNHKLQLIGRIRQYTGCGLAEAVSIYNGMKAL